MTEREGALYFVVSAEKYVLTSANTWCLSFSHNCAKGRPYIGAIGEGGTEIADMGDRIIADVAEARSGLIAVISSAFCTKKSLAFIVIDCSSLIAFSIAFLLLSPFAKGPLKC